MRNKFDYFRVKIFNIAIITATVFLMQIAVRAQTTLEQQCFNAVQGKVAYNQAGNKSWDAANINKLCQGTTDPGATISCFQNQIRQHNDWRRGIEGCKAGAKKIEIVAATPVPVANSPTNITQPVTGGSSGFGKLLNPNLTGQIPPGCREYDLQIKTGIQDDADSDTDVFVTINGSNGTTGEVNITNLKFRRSSSDPNSTCKSGNAGAQYVRFNQNKIIGENLQGQYSKTAPFVKNTLRDVTINAHDVGTISSVGIRHSSGRYYLMYLKVKSDFDDLFVPVNSWFTSSSPSRTFSPGPEPARASYQIKITTGDVYLAGTDANVYMTLEGMDGTKLPEFNLKTYISGRVLERGTTDEFTLEDLPRVKADKFSGNYVAKVHIRSDLSGADADWLLNSIEIRSTRSQSTFRYYDWITKDKSSVTLSYETLSLIDRTITFRNEAGFVARMMVQYMGETIIGNTRVPVPKFIATPFMPVGQNSTVKLPNVSPGSSIVVFLIGAGTSNDNFFITQLDYEFTGNKCFKAYNTIALPIGANCN